MDLYMSLCNMLDELPLWLSSPEAYGDPDASSSSILFRRTLFWS